MSKRIITVGRTYGSGGRLIGREVAEKLGFAFYDEELIDLSAGESGFSPDYIRANEQRSVGSFFATFGNQSFSYSKDTLPPEDTLFVAQCRVIQQLAEQQDCVIVGRCADYILRNFEPCLHVFVRSTPEDALRRVTDCYGVSADKAAGEINRVNRQRRAHCKRYTDRTWGAAENYDLVLNTARLGLEGCVSLVCTAAERAFAPPAGDVVYGD